MKKAHLLGLSILSGLLLSAAWPHYGFTPLIFIAFVPLLIVEETIRKEEKWGAFLAICSYTTFLIWNLLTTWWIYNASLGGAAMAILANALLMMIVFQIYHTVRVNLESKIKIRMNLDILLILFWIGFEYFHLDWDLTWPWLTLGNLFADYYKWVQWYEYTGVFGGSLWILMVNILLKRVLLKYSSMKTMSYKKVAISLAILILPIAISYGIYTSYDEKGENSEVIVIQPNIDPYNEKFEVSQVVQLQKMINLANPLLSQSTDFLVFPETALPESSWEDEMEESTSIKLLKSYFKKFPNLTIVIGANTYKAYMGGESPSSTARPFRDNSGFYDAYNTALMLTEKDTIQVYHKSKLVPGVEKMPFPSFFKLFENFAINMGGISGSLGVQKERTVFFSNQNIGIAPIICYESIYGEFIGRFLNKGADLIFIITNDGWWGDTPGYKQHLLYGRLRAIESRKPIARSANTGISCFINQKGDISQPTEWWEPDAIKEDLKVNTTPTFYTKYGDYIGVFCLWTALLTWGYSYIFSRRRFLKKA